MESIRILQRNKCIKESGVRIYGMGKGYTLYYQAQLELLAIFRKGFCTDLLRWYILTGRDLLGIFEME